MNHSKLTYLSYILNEETPTYGNRNKFVCEKKSDISKGDVANDTSISSTVHIGTHLDMPYHFFENGQTIEDFDINYFQFQNVLYIELLPDDNIINNNLISILSKVNKKTDYEILVVKTGICSSRKEESFWKENYGFDPSIATYIREKFPNIRVLGFDSISVSSFTNRKLGRESHRAFLNPEHPILLLEDMNLSILNSENTIKSMIIAPLRISKCDGLPCTVIAELE